MFDAARHVRQKAFLLSVVHEVIAHHEFLEPLRHNREKYFTNGIRDGNRAKLCGVTGIVRLGEQGNDGSCPADRYISSNPDFLEDFVEGVNNGWTTFVRDISKTVQTSSLCFA